MKTNFGDPYIAPNAQLHMSNFLTQDAIQIQQSRITNTQHPSNLSNDGYYYNSAGQLYLDTQGVHSNSGVAGAYPRLQ